MAIFSPLIAVMFDRETIPSRPIPHTSILFPFPFPFPFILIHSFIHPYLLHLFFLF